MPHIRLIPSRRDDRRHPGGEYRLSALRNRCTVYEHGIDTVLLLASRMSGHPNRSVRAYTDSIQRVLGPFADPPLPRSFGDSMVLPGGVAVSHTLAVFLRRWGDDLEGEDRWNEGGEHESMETSISRVEETRAWRCTDWLVRSHNAAWLEFAGMEAEAVAIRALPEISSSYDLKTATPMLRRIADRAERIRDRTTGEEDPDLTAHLVQVARSAWAATAAGAAVEAGAAWCPHASRASEAAMWTWAMTNSTALDGDEDPSWREDLQHHLDRLQQSALELVWELMQLAPPEIRIDGIGRPTSS